MRKRLALIALSLLAVLLAAYLIVLYWIWAKPRGRSWRRIGRAKQSLLPERA